LQANTFRAVYTLADNHRGIKLFYFPKDFAGVIANGTCLDGYLHLPDLACQRVRCHQKYAPKTQESWHFVLVLKKYCCSVFQFDVFNNFRFSLLLFSFLHASVKKGRREKKQPHQTTSSTLLKTVITTRYARYKKNR
jgi:hypothetical protein